MNSSNEFYEVKIPGKNIELWIPLKNIKLRIAKYNIPNTDDRYFIYASSERMWHREPLMGPFSTLEQVQTAFRMTQI